MSKSRGFCFSTFGKSRRIRKTKHDILSSIEKLPPVVLLSLDTESTYPESSSWGTVCKDLGIPNVPTNRTRVKNVYLRHKQSQLERQSLQASAAPETKDEQGSVLPAPDSPAASQCASTSPIKDATDEVTVQMY